MAKKIGRKCGFPSRGFDGGIDDCSKVHFNNGFCGMSKSKGALMGASQFNNCPGREGRGRHGDKDI